MSGGHSSSTASRFGKLFFGLLGGLSITVLAIGLMGDRGAKRVTEKGVAERSVGLGDVTAIPAAAQKPPVRRAAESEPAPVPTPEPPNRIASTRPLAIGGPPRADQFKPADSKPQVAPAPPAALPTRQETTMPSAGPAAGSPRPETTPTAPPPPSETAAPPARQVRVIEIGRAPDEVQAAPASTEPEAGAADAATPNTSALTNLDQPDAPRSPAAPAPASIQSDDRDLQVAQPPLPPPAPSPVRAAVDASVDRLLRAPLRTSSPRVDPEDAVPVTRPPPRPPFKPQPVAVHQNATLAHASPVRRVHTEPIPNLEQAYRRMRAESPAAIRQPPPHQSRVALGQPRRPASPPRTERPPPGQRLVVMHLRTYQGPDGELVDVLYRRRPSDVERPPARNTGGSPGSVMDWVNR